MIQNRYESLLIYNLFETNCIAGLRLFLAVSLVVSAALAKRDEAVSIGLFVGVWASIETLLDLVETFLEENTDSGILPVIVNYDRNRVCN